MYIENFSFFLKKLIVIHCFNKLNSWTELGPPIHLFTPGIVANEIRNVLYRW